MNQVYFLNKKDRKNLSSELLLPNGKLQLKKIEFYNKLQWEDLRLFCHEYARYGLPTQELIDCIKNIIGNKKALEIGSGHGDLGYHLGIPMTDSKIQQDPQIAAYYAAMRQPNIKYPFDVEKLEAMEAIEKYNPEVVVASWVTEKHDGKKSHGFMHGVREDKLLDLVEKYIFIGNVDIHSEKEILKRDHFTLDDSFIISRAANRKGNRIWIWKR